MTDEHFYITEECVREKARVKSHKLDNAKFSIYFTKSVSNCLKCILKLQRLFSARPKKKGK